MPDDFISLLSSQIWVEHDSVWIYILGTHSSVIKKNVSKKWVWANNKFNVWNSNYLLTIFRFKGIIVTMNLFSQYRYIKSTKQNLVQKMYYYWYGENGNSNRIL